MTSRGPSSLDALGAFSVSDLRMRHRVARRVAARLGHHGSHGLRQDPGAPSEPPRERPAKHPAAGRRAGDILARLSARSSVPPFRAAIPSCVTLASNLFEIDLYLSISRLVRSVRLLDKPQSCYGFSQLPVCAERKSASITRILRIASSVPYGSGAAPRTACENASPWRVY
jgi:hypothetical protein